MNIQEFLQKLLTDQELTVTQKNTLESHKEEVTKYLQKKYGSSPVIKYAGSLAKGTMIKDSFDLDIVCYFPSSDTRTLKEIREEAAAYLKVEYITMEKTSAERILDLMGSTTPSSYHIDVVPGRFIEDTKDVFLHIATADRERMQTNLKTHIDHIQNSNCASVIRLVKLWVSRNNLNLRTFVLELFVVRVLSGSRTKADFKKSFLEILKAFKDDFATMQLVDPANSANIVSKLVSDSDKIVISMAAQTALDTIESSDDVDDWRKVFKEASPVKAAVIGGSSSSFSPQPPWSI